MNKNAIQKYAVWARNELIAQVKQRAYQFGFFEESGQWLVDSDHPIVSGRVLSNAEVKQCRRFKDEIDEHGFQQAVEEVAYTWFNRFAALRFMEVNDYLPTHIRVFSDSAGAFNPEILKDVLRLELEGLNKAKVADLLHGNKTDELYRYLLLTQCNALNSALPEMFERLGGYTEMLLPGNILKSDGVIGRLISDIPEEDWRDAVQIIGWLYQYYNTEPKQAVFDGLKKNAKITKEKIPAATQLFTPEWIVRYMVENSLGRLWLEGHPNATLKAEWKYYLDEAEQTPEVTAKLEAIRSEYKSLTPEDIRFIDPCMGSGHILVYAFDVLMQIYRSEGYADRDAVKLILEKNLHGLDIDRRAYQLAYFSLMMKAWQYSRRVFTENIRPQVYHPAGWSDGEEYGSLLKIDDLGKKPEEPHGQLDLFGGQYERDLRVWNFQRLLSQKYDVVVTNPPYMGGKGMSGKLSEYVQLNYSDSKSDLFAVFIERCATFTKANGYQAMITQHAWMFLSSYEKLRSKLLIRDTVNMAHLGARAFAEIGGEVVQATAFVVRNAHIAGFKGAYVRLVDIDDADGKECAFLSGNHRYTADSGNFAKIPGSPVAYWVGAAMLRAFDAAQVLDDVAEPRAGLATGDNDIFQRFWFEVLLPKIGFGYSDIAETKRGIHKWFPCNSGSECRKWSTANEMIVLWENDGVVIRNHKNAKGRLGSRPQNTQWYFKEGLTWNKLSSSRFAVRYKEKGFIFDDTSRSAFATENLYYLIGLLCSAVSFAYLRIFNPTLSFTNSDLQRIPVIIDEQRKQVVESFVSTNISLSRADWDAFETSWDFLRHPLLPTNDCDKDEVSHE
jgi:hypothetical protein